MHESSIKLSDERIQTKEVVRMARMVPMGMERCASFKSPDRLEPAMIPEKQNHSKEEEISDNSTALCLKYQL